MPRVTVKLPVTVELTDEQLETAETLTDAAGVVLRKARDPEVRAVARRIADLVGRWRSGRRSLP
ncbi:MAG: hypothetical protein ACREU5_06910 [Burkholderiales bacterium]